MLRHVLSAAAALLLTTLAGAQNLCPNPGAEEGQGAQPTAWTMEGGAAGLWATDQAHSGQHSLKLVGQAGATRGWLSPIIPVTAPGQQFVVRVWAKLDHVTGENGAFLVLYHLNDKGERIGQSAEACLGGSGQEVATTDWTETLTISQLPPEVKGVRVNVRLYGATGTAWFDDISLQVHETKPLEAVRPLRRGLRVGVAGAAAIVAATGAEALAGQLQAALRAKGWVVPVLAPDKVDVATDQRDLIILGNLTNSTAAEYLYRRSYALEDCNFPGPGGYVLRPLVNPLGTGANLLVVGASDDAGLQAGAAALAERIQAATGVLETPLVVKSSGFRRIGGGWLEAGSIDYLTSGNLDAAKTYRETMLRNAAVPDSTLFGPDTSLHLFFVRQMLSWDLMESCGVFSDAERLTITRHLLKIARSDQGYGYGGLRAGMFSRENHGTRAARAFYYAWRYFDKYYADRLGDETALWRVRLQGFWAACFASSRTFEDSLSQHALGGAMVNILDIGLQEPEWSRDFFASGRARRMADRCLAICNNMGQTVLLGDTSAGDYPGAVFAILGYVFHDGRYAFMLDKRGLTGFTTDEPLRNFDVGLKPEVPREAIGLQIVPADKLFFETALQRRAGVTLEQAFDKLSLRSGFDPQDEYLMLDGTAGGSHSYDDANTIGEFSANGRRWLCEIDIFNGPTMSFHNAVTVAREGLGDPDVPQVAEMVTHASGDGYAYTATRLPHYNQTAWTRHLLWLPGRYTFVLDELTAEQPGDYSFVLGWRSLGQPTLKPGVFESAQDERVRSGLILGGKDLVARTVGHSGKVLYHLSDFDSLFYRAAEVGDYVEVAVPVPAAGEYEVVVRPLAYTGRGTIQASLDGKPLGSPLDLYVAGSPEFHETVLGKLTLPAGEHRVRFSVTGKNAQSTAYTFALGELGFYRAGERQQAQVSPNRFRLLFPASVPATLDQDTETLGKYLPTSPHYAPVLNIVEQSDSRKLPAGGTACFQNVFYAIAGDKPRTVELRRLNDHCALVKCNNEVALLGAGVAGVNLQARGIAAAGKLFYLSASRLLLHEATASFQGRPLASGGKAPAALVAALNALWQATKPETPSGAATSAAVARLATRATMDLPDRPLTVAAYQASEGTRLAAGLTNGLVRQFLPTGQPAGEFATHGPVHALLGCDVDGDRAQELLVGSDDECLYALKPDLRELWKVQVPFFASEQYWDWWTLGSAKVRQLFADDLNGDGKPEILMGNGNMRLHCYDAAGKELWRFRTDHGICTTITTADLYGDGQRRVLAGNGLTSDQGSCWVLDAQGQLLQTHFNGSWCTALPAIAVGDLDGDGKQTVFCGNNRGDIRAYPGVRGQADQLWIHNLTRPIRSLTVLPRPGGGLVAVGSDSGYLCAFNQAGEKAWGVPLSSAIIRTALARRGAAPPRLVAGCKDGRVFVLDVDGKLLGATLTGGRLEELVTADTDGDGTDEIIAATSGPHRLHVLKTP